jgi:transposase
MAGQRLPEGALTEKRKYRTFTPDQKLAIVLAGLRGEKSVKELCRDHQISETLYDSWRDQLLEAGKERYAGAKGAASETTELRRKVSQLERALGRKTYELEIAGELSRGWE